jgi:short-subunit dehydrogenase
MCATISSHHGIRVKLVEPGHIKTDFISRSLELAKHSAYEAHFDNYMAWVARLDEDASQGAAKVAKVIFKAATDNSDRLRYPVKSGPIAAMHAILPDTIWRWMLGAGLNRRPRDHAPTAAKVQR